MGTDKYSKVAILNHRNNLEMMVEIALNDADDRATPEERQALNRLTPTLRHSAAIITQLVRELDKASFANSTFEQRCQDLKSQLQRAEKNLDVSLTL